MPGSMTTPAEAGIPGKYAEAATQHMFLCGRWTTKTDTPVISKELFCTAIHLLKEQESIDDEFGRALQKVGNGHFAYGTENKYRKALLMVLKDAINDQYDYIDWWLYEGAPDYKIWNEDESIEWDLTEPEALYDFITIECK